MKNLFFLIALSFYWSGNAYAEWKSVSIAKDKSSEFYVNPNNISIDGERRYFWTLTNVLRPELSKTDALSFLVYHELDCKKFRAIDLKFMAKSEKWGKGETLADFEPEKKWKYANPGSNKERVWKFVCKY